MSRTEGLYQYDGRFWVYRNDLELLENGAGIKKGTRLNWEMLLFTACKIDSKTRTAMFGDFSQYPVDLGSVRSFTFTLSHP